MKITTVFPQNEGKASALPADALPRLIEAFLLAGDINRHSPQTLSSRRERLGRLVWFLTERGFVACALPELRAFFHYLAHSHERPEGRWNNPRCKKPLAPGRIKAFHSTLRTFFNWLVEEEELGASPLRRIPAPVDRADQIQPFSDEQVRALLEAARKGACPRRDSALLLLMLDTGVRAGELCRLKVADLNLQEFQIAVRHGKGGKARLVPISPKTRKALFVYLSTREASPQEPLFVAERGGGAGVEGLTPWGLIQLFHRLARRARLCGVRCSPHTMRHTAAVNFIRAGGSEFSLQTLLGHTSLAMTRRYVALCQADVAEQHRRFSPVMKVLGKEKSR